MSGDPVVVVPGDLDVEDRIAGPLTFRMAAWLAAAAGGAALIAASQGDVARVVLGAVLVVAGAAGAWARPGGRPLGAWVAPLVAYRRRRRSYAAPVDDEPQARPAEVAEDAIEDVTVRRRPSRRWSLVAVFLAVGVAAAGVAVGAGLGGADAPSPDVAVETPPPAPGGPVVVVVPVDPYGGWEVGGDVVDPFCGC